MSRHHPLPPQPEHRDQDADWDPLDLSEDALTSANHRAVALPEGQGPGILPDVDTRPSLRPVARPRTNPWGSPPVSR